MKNLLLFYQKGMKGDRDAIEDFKKLYRQYLRKNSQLPKIVPDLDLKSDRYWRRDMHIMFQRMQGADYVH